VRASRRSVFTAAGRATTSVAASRFIPCAAEGSAYPSRSAVARRQEAGTTKAIQELAGPVSLTTMQRYMHLSPAAKESAIRLLEFDV